MFARVIRRRLSCFVLVVVPFPLAVHASTLTQVSSFSLTIPLVSGTTSAVVPLAPYGGGLPSLEDFVSDATISIHTNNQFTGYSSIPSVATSVGGAIARSTNIVSYDLTSFGLIDSPVTHEFGYVIPCATQCGPGNSATVTLRQSALSTVKPPDTTVTGGPVPVTIVNFQQSLSGGAVSVGTYSLFGVVSIAREIGPPKESSCTQATAAKQILCGFARNLSVVSNAFGLAAVVANPEKAGIFVFDQAIKAGLGNPGGVVTDLRASYNALHDAFLTLEAEADAVNPFSLILDALSATFGNLAAYVERIADDPPDPDYLTVSPLQDFTFVLPASAASSPAYAAGSQALSDVGSLTSCEDGVLHALEKMAGARAAADPAGIALQQAALDRAQACAGFYAGRLATDLADLKPIFPSLGVVDQPGFVSGVDSSLAAQSVDPDIDFVQALVASGVPADNLFLLYDPSILGTSFYTSLDQATASLQGMATLAVDEPPALLLFAWTGLFLFGSRRGIRRRFGLAGRERRQGRELETRPTSSSRHSASVFPDVSSVMSALA